MGLKPMIIQKTIRYRVGYRHSRSTCKINFPRTVIVTIAKVGRKIINAVSRIVTKDLGIQKLGIRGMRGIYSSSSAISINIHNTTEKVTGIMNNVANMTYGIASKPVITTTPFKTERTITIVCHIKNHDQYDTGT